MTSAPRLHLADGGRPSRDEGEQRIAAIDIGSNSIRQIIADVSPSGSIRVVDEMKAAPRLGTGLHETNVLADEPMRLAIEALTRMALLAKQLGAQRVEAVATSAVREASNSIRFIQRIRHETGLKVRVLVGEEEARLAYRSALAHFEIGRGRAVVMDIGGGSLELALAAEGLVERLISLPFGALRLSEQFLRPEPRPKSVKKLRKFIRDEIRAAIPARDWRGSMVIGSGGTFTNLAGIHLARQGLQAARSVHGTRIPRVDVDHILELLGSMTLAERLGVPGLNAGRADIIVAGLAVAAEVLDRVEPRDLAASAFGIREGLLLDVARVMPTTTDPGVARERSVREFAERCHYEEPHARQVQRLALQLFDSLGKRLGCESGERAMLADAALLHDVGYHINYQGHNKHSYHLIVHADLLGVAPGEQLVIAHVARYHRGALPDKKKHPAFGQLDKATRQRIRRLSAILRMADGFDRGHIAEIDQLRPRRTERALRVHATAVPRAKSLRLELWGGARKSDLLAELLGVPIEVVAPDGTVVRAAEMDERVE
ncbi:MAG: Ppx/GppA family phosphatase [Gemmatimonadetes bacterium]|nr:Ppx/GppA family phosphatase [Gemmatimonadota bacterium]